MLGVQSYPELYTTVLGWMQYQNAWDMLTQTGIATLPFIYMLIKNLIEPYTSMGAKSAAEITMRRIEIDFFGMLLVIFLAAKPIVNLDPTVLQFAPVCGQGKVATVGHTKTTYDHAFENIVTPTAVPALFYFVIAGSEGVTSGMTSLLGCQPNLREMMEDVHLTKISDPTIRAQTQAFYQQCFMPARSQYLRAQKSMSQTQFESTFKSYQDKYGVADTEWLGSHTYRSVSGFYDTLHASRAVPGFPYNESRDWDEAQTGNTPEWGKPSCKDWWEDKDNGLEKQLLSQLPNSWLKEFENYFSDSPDKADDAIKSIIDNTPGSGYQGASSMVKIGGYSSLSEQAGALWTQMTEYPKLYTVEQAMPIVRALLLMTIYAFLPFMLVFTAFRFKTVIIVSFVIFSLIYWAYLWHFVQYVDQVLIKALYSNWFHEQSSQATLTDFIIGAMMVTLPMFWFSAMGTAGVIGGGMVEGAFSSLKDPAGEVGKQAGSMGKDALEGAVVIAAEGLV